MDEDLKKLAAAKIQQEEIEFEKWYKKEWRHIQGIEYELCRSVAKSAWMQRSVQAINI